MKPIVERVRGSREWDFSNKEGLCAYSHLVKVAIHQADPNFMELKKTAAQNHCVDPLDRRRGRWHLRSRCRQPVGGLGLRHLGDPRAGLVE